MDNLIFSIRYINFFFQLVLVHGVGIFMRDRERKTETERQRERKD